MNRRFSLRSILSRLLLFSSSICAGVLGVCYLATANETRPSTSSDEPSSAAVTDKAIELVGRALKAEMNGDIFARERHLNAALLSQPDFAPNHWYQGSLLGPDEKWISVEEAIELSKGHALLNEYTTLRAKQPRNVAGQWATAVWCAQKGLGIQCRAHLLNILMRDPEHKPARLALGHQLVGGEWMSPKQVSKLLADTEATRAATAKYGEQVTRLLVVASNDSHFGKVAAKEKLLAIQDSAVIPVIEAAAQNLGDKASLIVVECLARFDNQAASLAIARIATYSPSAEVREYALKELKQRSLYDYVPQLLNAMSSPIAFSTVPVFKPNGELKGFQQAFAKEGMSEKRLWRFDTSLEKYRNVGLYGKFKFERKLIRINRDPTRPFGSRNTYLTHSMFLYKPNANSNPFAGLGDELARLAAEHASKVATTARIAEAREENLEIDERNRLLGNVLSKVANVPFKNLPADAWNWWDQYNETDYQSDKQLRRRYDVATFVSEASNTPEVIAMDSKITCGSCFVAGTTVTTSQGSRPIEAIVAGDLVLSRDVGTGELCFMPVVAATQRKPAKTVILKVNEEELHATSSHLLWVSGKGWTKAGEIEVGDLLHSAAEPAVVMGTTPSDVLPTHNLVVADHHTYFVGSSQILSHDVLPRIHAHETIPGEFVFLGSK